MAEEKKQQQPEVKPQPKSLDEEVTEVWSEFADSVKGELGVLVNVHKFLRRVKNIDGEEARAFIEALDYVQEKHTLIKVAELSRVKARLSKKPEEPKKSEESK